jgi:hypothetical protein
MDNEKSHLSVFKQLVTLRSQLAFKWGCVQIVTANEQILAFLRKAFGFEVYLVAMNLSDSTTTANLLVNNEIAPRAYVALYIPGKADGKSKDAETVDLEAKYKVKSPVLTKSVTLKARDCLILRWPTSD